MKKYCKKIRAAILFLLLVVVVLSLSNMTSVGKKFLKGYLDNTERCEYYFGQDQEIHSGLSKNSCLYESEDTGYALNSNTNSMISGVVELDFPGYVRVDSWIDGPDMPSPTIATEKIQRTPLVKAVWPCSYPEIQRLTTTTVILALCSVAPSHKGNSYESSVAIYEIHFSGSDFTRELLYAENASPSTRYTRDVFLSVSYPIVHEKLSVLVKQHELKWDGTSAEKSRWMLPWGRGFVTLYDFYGSYSWSTSTATTSVGNMEDSNVVE